MCSQEWKRNAPYNLRNSFKWTPDTRLLMESNHHQLQSLSNPANNDYWKIYLATPQTTTPASIALFSGLTGFVAEAAIPRFINAAGD